MDTAELIALLGDDVSSDLPADLSTRTRREVDPWVNDARRDEQSISIILSRSVGTNIEGDTGTSYSPQRMASLRNSLICLVRAGMSTEARLSTPGTLTALITLGSWTCRR